MAKQTVCSLSISRSTRAKRDAFEAIAQEMVAGSQKESGTLGYDGSGAADASGPG